MTPFQLPDEDGNLQWYIYDDEGNLQRVSGDTIEGFQSDQYTQSLYDTKESLIAGGLLPLGAEYGLTDSGDWSYYQNPNITDLNSFLLAYQGPGQIVPVQLADGTTIQAYKPDSGVVKPLPDYNPADTGMDALGLPLILSIASGGLLSGLGGLTEGALASGLTEGATLASEAGFVPGAFELGTSSYGGTAAAGLDAAAAELAGGLTTTAGTVAQPYDFFNEMVTPASGTEYPMPAPEAPPPPAAPPEITSDFLTNLGYTPEQAASLLNSTPTTGSDLPPIVPGASISPSLGTLASGAGTAATLGTAATQGDTTEQANFEGATGGAGGMVTEGDITGATGTAGTAGLLDKILNGTATAADWAKIVAPLAGGALGYLSGQDTNDQLSWMKPYQEAGLNAGLNALNNNTQLNATETNAIDSMLQKLMAPNAALDASNQTLTDTASGKYLDLANNPYWQRNMDLLGRNYNEVLRPGTDSAFSRANAFGVGNSAWEEMTGRNARALAEGQGAATAGVWNQERANQLGAAQNMPAWQTSYLTGLGNQALQLGNYQRTQPWQGILNYGNLVANTQNKNNQTQQNPLLSALGGALTGSSLSRMWG